MAFFLPGIDQVLGQADTGVGASNGDLSVSWALHRVGNLDLSPWHLTDLIDLCALTANDAANELGKNNYMTLCQYFHCNKIKVKGCQFKRNELLRKSASFSVKKKKIKVTLILTYIVWNGQLMRASLCRGIHPSWKNTRVSWLHGLTETDSNQIPPHRKYTYPGSPGCCVQWERGSAAWPAGEVWWAVETKKRKIRRAQTRMC